MLDRDALIRVIDSSMAASCVFPMPTEEAVGRIADAILAAELPEQEAVEELVKVAEKEAEWIRSTPSYERLKTALSRLEALGKEAARG